MPIMDGFTATRLIRRTFPETRVLLLSIAASPEYRAKAQEVGAAGYLLKEAIQQELVTAIHQVLAGEQLFD
jgi:DNA-binding NarL/FixJ family response regulator